MATPPTVPPSFDDDVFSVPPPAPPPLPHAMEGERRAHARAPYFTPISILRESEALVLEGRSVDLSEGGMLVLTREPLRDAELIVVRFAPPFAAKTESFRAKVRWAKPGAAGTRSHTAGLSYLAVTEDAGARIVAYAELAQKFR